MPQIQAIHELDSLQGSSDLSNATEHFQCGYVHTFDKTITPYFGMLGYIPVTSHTWQYTLLLAF